MLSNRIGNFSSKITFNLACLFWVTSAISDSFWLFLLSLIALVGHGIVCVMKTLFHGNNHHIFFTTSRPFLKTLISRTVSSSSVSESDHAAVIALSKLQIHNALPNLLPVSANYSGDSTNVVLVKLPSLPVKSACFSSPTHFRQSIL